MKQLLLLLAAVLMFQDTSGVETGFVVQIIKADGVVRYDVFPPAPSTGPVTLNLPTDGPGDCFLVAAFNTGGTSPWSNRACIAIPAANVPNAPTGAAAK